jgi:trimethylamine--corrinoid protein Co-methyltransferase
MQRLLTQVGEDDAMPDFRGAQKDLTNPHLRFLDEEQCRKVHEATLALLEKTGVSIDESECLEMLRGAGARVLDMPPKSGSKIKRRVQIPSYLVENAIRSAPESVTIYDRNGQEAMVLRDREYYFGCNIDCPDFLDPFSKERRKIRLADIRTSAVLLDYLQNMDWILTAGVICDFEKKYADRAVAREVLMTTSKPIAFCCNDPETVTDVFDMAAAIVGGHDRLRLKPNIMVLDEQISPLLHGPESVKRVLKAAELEIPLIYVPMPMAGVSAPCSLIGPVLIGNAESLSGLVFHQLKRKGAPYIYGALPSTADMKFGSFNYGAPELSIMCSAIADMAHYYKLPVWGTGGCGDSNSLDAQAGVEMTLSLMSSVLAGANLVHDIGILSQGLLVSPTYYFFSDEIVRMVKQFARGFEVNDKTLALDLIEEIGPGGSFISHNHTFLHYKDMWMPRFFDRTNSERLKEGHVLDCGERARQKTIEIIETHKPTPLSKETLKDLSVVSKRWDRGV